MIAARPLAMPTQVDNAAAIKVGEYYDLLWADVNGKFNNLM